MAPGSPRRIAVVASPGRDRAEAAEGVVGVARRRGDQVLDLVGVGLDSLTGTLASLVRDGIDRIVACGGDGIVHHVATAAADSETIIGIVPVGTGNDFARALPIPASRQDAIAAAVAGPARTIDGIRCGSVVAASVATTGFSHDVSMRADALTFPRGPSVYAVATVIELPRLRSRSATIVLDGDSCDISYSLIAVANTGWFGGGMHVCPDADPTDGHLDLMVIDAVSRRVFARVFPRVFSGSHVAHPAVRTRRCRSIEIHPHDDETSLWADGERLDGPELSCEIAPGALRIALPAGAPMAP